MSSQIHSLLKEAAAARRADRPDDAHSGFAKAVALSRQVGAQRELIEALKGLGQIERDRGKADNALPLYEEAAAICRRESDALLLAHTVRHLGDIHQEAGRIDVAEPCYREALQIYRGNPATGRLDLANTLRPFATVQENRGNTADAIALWKEARDIYAALGIREGVAEGDRNLARLSAG